VALSLGVVALLFPLVGVTPEAALPLQLTREAARGLALGLASVMWVHALSAAAAFLDQLRGAPQVYAVVPLTSPSPLAQLQLQLCVLLLLAIGGPTMVLERLGTSVLAAPLGSPLGPGPIRALVALWGSGLKVGLQTVAPGVAACLWVDVVFGVLNRWAPATNAYLMALGLRSLLGLAVYALALPWSLERLQDLLSSHA
jgi:flagellar biosynthetic protein FliR